MSSSKAPNLEYIAKENYAFPLPDKNEDAQAYQAYNRYASFNAKKMQSQQKRWAKFWQQRQQLVAKNKMKHELSPADKDSKDVKKLTRKGVPPELRGKVWFQISGAAQEKDKNPGYYAALKKENQGKVTRATQQIDNDVDRTFPEHPFFAVKKNLETLRIILYAYSWRNPTIGYCQSLNFLAGIILLHLDDEEDSFWLLDTMLRDYLPNDLYDETLFGLYCECHVLEQLTAQRHPKLAKHLQKMAGGVNYALFGTSWFLCVFLTVLPIETSLRVWDALFVEGYKIIYRVALTILGFLENDLLKIEDQGILMMTCMKAVRNMYDVRALIKNAFAIRRFSKSSIKSFRDTYRATHKKPAPKVKKSSSNPAPASSTENGTTVG